MRTRAAPTLAAALCLVLSRAGPSHALSLRSSAAEVFLGDASPGAEVTASKATGRKLRVEDTGAEKARVRLEAASPPPSRLKDGWDPWPDPGTIRVEPSRAELSPGGSAEFDVAARSPKGLPREGGQYQADVVLTGTDPSGGSLSLRTRVLLSFGPPLARASDRPDGGWTAREWFSLSPPRAGPSSASPGEREPDKDATLKIVDAGDEDLTVTLRPARDWDPDVGLPEGYEPAPDPRWLRLEPGVVKVRAGAIGSARIGAVVPRQARYAGRKFAFVAAVDAEAGGRKTRRWFVLLVDTTQWEEDSRVR